MLPQQYCLRWKYHHSNLQTMFSQLLDRGCFCDVTLACEGQLIRAHRVVLCACSTFFDTVLSNYASERDPIIIMKDVTFAEVKCLIEFMYKGEINVEHASLPSLLKTADDLKIKGLAEVSWRDDEDGPSPPMPATEFHTPPRNLADSYGPDMLQQQQHQQHQHHQQQQQQAQAHGHAHQRLQRQTPEREHHSPAMDGVLGLSGRMPALTPIPGTTANMDSAAAHYLGPKRKRGRPPLDDTYDVFNVRHLAHYAANLEPVQRAYLESARHFADESQSNAHSASPPSAASSYTTQSAQQPKLRHRHKQQQQQQQHQPPSTQTDIAESYASNELESAQEWQAKQSDAEQRSTPAKVESGEGEDDGIGIGKGNASGNAKVKISEEANDDDTVDVKHDIEMVEDLAAAKQAAAASAAAAAAQPAKKSEKAAERRERHGKLRHARRCSAEREKSADKATRQRSTAAATTAAGADDIEEDVMGSGALVPQPVEEIENEHLVANRSNSPAKARAPAALLHAGFGKYAATAAEGGYLLSEHGMLMPHDFAPNAAAASAAAATVAVAAAAAVAAVANANANTNVTNGGSEHGANASDYADIKVEDYDAADLRLTNEELSQWQDVIKMDDYLAKGRRPQFWEEPFTKRVLDAIKNKRLEMKKAARILGVSYGTLYGRYREVYGCLKHPYSGTAFRNSSASSAASQLAVQPRFDLSFRNGGVLPAQLELGKLRPKDLSELWTRPQI